MFVKLFLFFLCRTRVTLKRDGVVLDLVPPPTKVNNLIFGRTWVDSPGEMVMSNLTTGDKVVLYFQPCGWFGYFNIFLPNHVLFRNFSFSVNLASCFLDHFMPVA